MNASHETDRLAEANGPAVAVHDEDVYLARLMTEYQQGDAVAFEGLYEALAPRLRGYLRALARDAIWADDLLQETFLQVHRARRTYQPPRPVRPWIYAIARNVFLMGRRAAGRRSRREILADDELPDLPVPPEVDGLADRLVVRRAVASLPEPQREALVMHHILGLSFKEVGAALGISEGAAKVRAHRGMQELRRLIVAPGGPS